MPQVSFYASDISVSATTTSSSTHYSLCSVAWSLPANVTVNRAYWTFSHDRTITSGSGVCYCVGYEAGNNGNSFTVAANASRTHDVALDAGREGTESFYFGVRMTNSSGYTGQSRGLSHYGAIALVIEYTVNLTACTQPTSVTLDALLAETTTALRWSGAGGGVGNAISGYRVQSCDSSDGNTWSSWSDVGAYTGTSAAVAPPGTRGHYRKFRVKAYGTAGEAYESPYTECGMKLRKNRAPGIPRIVYPASASTHCASPVLALSEGADPDGQTQALYFRLDGGDWVRYLSPTRIAVAVGTHKLEIKAVDSMGAETAGASASFAVTSPIWSRVISTGDVIGSATVSHRADIAEMLVAVNRQRAWYGLSALTLDNVGAFAKWRDHMSTMRAGLNTCYTRAGLPAPQWLTLTGWPSAAVINQIRERVTEI